jgi:hypothetical protein
MPTVDLRFPFATAAKTRAAAPQVPALPLALASELVACIKGPHLVSIRDILIPDRRACQGKSTAVRSACQCHRVAGDWSHVLPANFAVRYSSFVSLSRVRRFYGTCKSKTLAIYWVFYLLRLHVLLFSHDGAHAARWSRFNEQLPLRSLISLMRLKASKSAVELTFLLSYRRR